MKILCCKRRTLLKPGYWTMAFIPWNSAQILYYKRVTLLKSESEASEPWRVRLAVWDSVQVLYCKWQRLLKPGSVASEPWRVGLQKKRSKRRERSMRSPGLTLLDLQCVAEWAVLSSDRFNGIDVLLQSIVMHPWGLSDRTPVSVWNFIFVVLRDLASIVSSAPGHVMRGGVRKGLCSSVTWVV